MFCTKCGHNNTEGSAFCVNCGNPMNAVNQQPQPPQGQYAPPQGQYAPPDGPYTSFSNQGPGKNRKGLVIGLVICGVVIIAAAVVLIILLTGGSGASIQGQWYNEERMEVVEFGAGSAMTVYGTDGDYDGTYAYDSAKSEGVITLEGSTFAFEVDKDEMDVEDIGVFTKAGQGFDIDEFLSGPIPMNNGNSTGSTVTDSSQNGTQNGMIGQSGIVGMWYETTGYGGTLEFYNNGTYNMSVMGMSLSGDYTFDPASGTGEMNLDFAGDTTTSTMSLSNGVLDVDGTEYTMNYVEQMDLDDAMNNLNDALDSLS